MILAFFTVGKQVLTLFFLMLTGYILGKSKLIAASGSVNMSNLVMYVVSPAMMVVAFQRELVPGDLKNFLIVLLMGVIIHVIGMVLSRLCVRDDDHSRRATLQFATVFSNCGFMGYPLMTAILGTIGVFYGSAYVVIFTVLAWTWGVITMTGQRGKLSWKPILLNPGVISVVAAMSLYLLQITLPDFLMTPITHLSQLNTPLPMVIVGYQLSQADFRAAFKGVSSWITLLLRLIIIPLITIGLCFTLHLDGAVAMVLAIASATPPAALLSMFSAKFGTDTSLASSVVSVQTAISVLTMPILVGLAQYLFG